jgi:hypothetical protein
MAKIPGNKYLSDSMGNRLYSLCDINALEKEEKERIYSCIVPDRLYEIFSISPRTFTGDDGERKVFFTAPHGLGLLRVEIRLRPGYRDTVFFLEIADNRFQQMELSLCVVNDPASDRFDVDSDENGNYNYFSTLGRNIGEEIRAMKAGLYPNQTHRGLRMFGDFFTVFERFVDSLSMDVIIAEPLTYDNAIRYEKFGFDYITGRRLMIEIDDGFRPGNILYNRLDGSTPFRAKGMEQTAWGRSWAIHDGIMDRPWKDVTIYKTVGSHAGVNTFPGRES